MKNNLLFLITLLSAGAVAQTPRLCLYEEFTGETCPPCAATNPGLNTLLALPTNTPKVVAIKWQVPIPSAPSAPWSLYQTNKADIDWRFRSTANGGYGYNPAISSAPTGKMDGQSPSVFGAASSHPGSLNSSVISTAQSYTSAFSVTMTRNWDTTGNAIDLTVNIVASANFSAVGNLIFRTVMVEKEIHFTTAPGSNGEKDFEDIAISSYPTLQNGIAMASNWTVGQSQTFALHCVIPSYCRKKGEIAFVGFIQDDGNQKVAQAVRAGKQALPNDVMASNVKVNVACSSTISPELTVKNNGLYAVTAMTITPYVDGAAATPVNWTGNLAPGATTMLTLSAINTPTVSGSHTFSFNITAINAADFDLSNNGLKVAYVVANNYQGTPVEEDFLSAAFPPAGFTYVNPNNGTNGWSRVTTAGGFNLSTQCAKYNFFQNTVIGDQDELVLPPIDLTGGETPVMEFDVAHATRNSSNDKLEVFVSDNCGNTWTSVYSQAGSALATVANINLAYLPDANDDTHWRRELVLLNGFNKNGVIVKFVTTNDNGNNLYIDNINLRQLDETGLNAQSKAVFNAEVYPNPSKNADIVLLKVNTPVSAKAVTKIVNAIGQLVAEKQISLNAGANTLPVYVQNYPSGVYSIIIESGNNTVVKKLVVTH